MPYINAIGTAVPPYRISQNQTLAFFDRFFENDTLARRKMQMLCRTSQINFRYSVLADFEELNSNNFYGKQIPTTADRMQAFETHALPLARKAVENCLEKIPNQREILDKITHLVTVSCTGMYAAGLDIELVDQLGLASSVQRTCVNFMGCYASFNALKLAQAFCLADSAAKVLIVGVELCSLHLQPLGTDDFLLANSLFADGAAAVLVSNEMLENQSKPNLELSAFHCDLARKGKDDMAWYIRNYGFEMRLSSYIPALLKEGLNDLVEKLLKKIQVKTQNIDFWAIHSGGKKILEAAEQSLGISAEENRFAYHILQNYGNMSSVSIIFVLEEIWKHAQMTDQNKTLLAMAFGPGLTLESAFMRFV